MHLYKTIFVCTFGRGKQNMAWAALIRIGLLAASSVGLGLALASLLPPLPTQIGNSIPLLCSSVFITQVVVMAVLLASYGIIKPSQNDVLAQLLLYWPIRPSSAWLALLMPGCTISLLAIGFIAPSLYVLFTQLGIDWGLITITMVTGWGSALGIVYGLPRRLGWIQAIVIGALLALHYWLIHLLYSSQDNYIEICMAWGALVTLHIALLLRSFYSLVQEASSGKSSRQVWGFLPDTYWFIKKLYRGHVTKIGIIATVLIGLVLCLAMWRLAVFDLPLMSTTAAILAAALASDVRSLTKRLRPFEIIGLRGTLYFTLKQLTATALTCVFAVSPLLISIVVFCEPASFSEWVGAVIVPLFLGIGCGVFASTLAAPGPHDITAQSGATLLATGIFVLPQLSAFSQLTDTTVGTIKITLLVVLLIGSAFIEHKRNPYIWRSNNAAH